MNTHHLREFILVARLQSFTEAANVLHVGQSTISKHVSALERELGASLLCRDRDGIHLTQAGRALYAAAASIVRIEDSLKRSFAAQASEGNPAPTNKPAAKQETGIAEGAFVHSILE